MHGAGGQPTCISRVSACSIMAQPDEIRPIVIEDAPVARFARRSRRPVRLCTDGQIEARSADGEELRVERVMKMAASNRSGSRGLDLRAAPGRGALLVPPCNRDDVTPHVLRRPRLWSSRPTPKSPPLGALRRSASLRG